MGLLLRIRPFAGIFFAVEFLRRLPLLARAIIPAEIGPGEIVQILLRGLWLDTYYQSASRWRDNYRRIPTVVNAEKR